MSVNGHWEMSTHGPPKNQASDLVARVYKVVGNRGPQLTYLGAVTSEIRAGFLRSYSAVWRGPVDFMTIIVIRAA
jgi:hypothetical protein